MLPTGPLLCMLDCKVLRKDVSELVSVVPPKVDIKLEKLDCNALTAEDVLDALVALALTELTELTELAVDDVLVTDELELDAADGELSCAMRSLSSVDN